MAWVSRASELCAVYTFIVLLRAVCCVINIIVVNGLVGVCVGVRVFACARACVCACVFPSKGCHVSLLTPVALSARREQNQSRLSWEYQHIQIFWLVFLIYLFHKEENVFRGCAVTQIKVSF